MMWNLEFKQNFSTLNNDAMSTFSSYTCLLFPSGHTKQLGDSPGNDFQHVIANNHSVSEVRRARLNQVSNQSINFYQYIPRKARYKSTTI